MSLINDALKRAENAKLDKLAESESPPEIPSATYGRPTGRKLLGPLTVVCLLAIGGGLVAYRYLGPDDGPGPQAATANSNTSPPPAAQAAEAEPEVDQWVNPAFKDLSPQAANAIRAEIAKSLVQTFFDTGSSLNAYAVSLSSPRPTRAKPTVETTGPTGGDVARNKHPKSPIASKTNPTASTPKPAGAGSVKPKPKAILSAVAAGVDPTTFRVNGIMFNGANSMAIINEGVYSVGQKVSGAVVDSITPSTVILRVGDKKFKVGM